MPDIIGWIFVVFFGFLFLILVASLVLLLMNMVLYDIGIDIRELFENGIGNREHHKITPHIYRKEQQ